jgi:type VI secretion system protein ImpL
MKRLLRLLHPVVLAVLALLMLVLLVWFFGPLIAFGESRPLDGVFERSLAIAVILLVAGAVYGVRVWRRRRKGRQLVEAVSAGPTAGEREAQVLQQRFKEALQALEDSARKTGQYSFLRRGQYLYDLPWYVFIGAPGSGKTTALMNAGLTFPLAGKLGQAALRGVGGTRNCDWWFTDQAVLIDTAGRYTLQQSDEVADASAWKTFLGLLRKARPRRPINGILLTVNVQDLLQQSPADRKEHALRLRTRLQELHENLGVRPPVYVLVTKCDLIAGFNETFGDLGREEREQVWGFTLPYDDAAAAARSASPVQAFDAEFEALERRLREQLIDRLQAQTDVLQRAATFAFPPQFSVMKAQLGGFLEQVFGGGGGLEEPALVRGVYFTSGTQEGSPIDRVLGTLGRTFGVDGRSASPEQAGRGKAYFLTRLLKEVVFREQGLVGVNRRTEGRRRALRMGAMAAIATVAVVAVGVWTVSFVRNKAYIDLVQSRVPELKTAVAELPPATGPQMSVLPQVLDRAATLPDPSGFTIPDPPLLNTLGLYEGEHVAAGADIAYRRLLDKALLPRVTRRIEERLRAVNRDNLELAYESLKHYLMLYTPEHFDAGSLAAFVSLDWDANLAGSLSAEQRQALVHHLDAAFSRGAPPPTAPMDQALVANVRDMLAVYPLEFRIFSRLRRSRVGSDIPDFTVAGAAGPNALRVFERASGQPLTQGIPGLFTKDGYFKAFRTAQSRVTKAMAEEEGWVMGRRVGNVEAQANVQKAGAALGVSTDELEQKVRRLYLQEYIKVWDQYIADVRVVRLGGLDTSITVAGLLAAPDSPLKAWLRAIARETQLEATVNAMAGNKLAKAAAAVQVERAKQELEQVLGVRPGAGDGSGTGRPLEAMVDDHFARLHRLVEGQPAPIDDVLKLFNEVFVQLTAIDAAQKSKTAPPPGGGAAAKAAAALQPEPVKSMLETLADAGATQGRSAERQGLTSEFKPVADLCMRTIAGRYPFAKGSRADVLPDDFGQIFGVGGQLDDFYQRRLASLVDTGATPWAFRPLPDGTKPAGGAALADFQRAARIREAFFRGGGKTPGFKVDLRMLEMSDGLSEVVIDVDGQPLKFVAGNTSPQTFSWPSSRIASQIRLSGTPGGAVKTFEGPWAFFRLIDQFEVQPSTQPERFVIVLNVEGKRARMEVISGSALNPLRLGEMQAFRCPQTL